MSSARKDARWQLGYDMLADTPAKEALGSGLPYAVGQKILDAAQALLEHFNDPELDARLADRWNKRGEYDEHGQVPAPPSGA